jgi:hypothetical protein
MFEEGGRFVEIPEQDEAGRLMCKAAYLNDIMF